MCQEFKTLPAEGGLLQQPHGYILRLKKVLLASYSVDKAKRSKDNSGNTSKRNPLDSSSEESSVDDD